MRCNAILLIDFGGVENIFDGDVRSSKQFSFPMNLNSCCSKQMDIPESFEVTMNGMRPIVFWNMIGLMVVSWCGQGFTMMVDCLGES